MYSKWPSSCWASSGWLLSCQKKEMSSEGSCVALQLSTTLSPTVTSTRFGLRSTLMASGRTTRSRCHLRKQTRTYHRVNASTSAPVHLPDYGSLIEQNCESFSCQRISDLPKTGQFTWWNLIILESSCSRHSTLICCKFFLCGQSDVSLIKPVINKVLNTEMIKHKTLFSQFVLSWISDLSCRHVSVWERRVRVFCFMNRADVHDFTHFTVKQLQ